jgi:hypothetical protein
MEIMVRGKNDAVSRKELKYVLNFFGNILLGPRLGKNVSIDLYNCDLSRHEMGFCNPTYWEYNRPRDFEILLNSNLPKDEQIVTLAHEMVHVKQYARNEWKVYDDDIHRWRGKTIYMPESKYKKMPWEKEARLSEPWLHQFYEQHCENNGLTW